MSKLETYPIDFEDDQGQTWEIPIGVNTPKDRIPAVIDGYMRAMKAQQKNKDILASQAAKFPTSAEQGGTPGAPVAPGSGLKMPVTLGNVFKATMNTAPEADTGMGSPAVKMLAAAAPGGAATEGMGIVQGLKNSPLARLIPSKAAAQANFEQVAAKANNLPIDTTQAEKIAAEAQDLGESGFRVPKVLNKFAKNRANAEGEAMTFEKGRKFASKASQLTASEIGKTEPSMRAKVAQFANAMKDANREAAVKAGVGEQYDAAMKEFRAASSLAEKKDVIKKWAIGIGAGALGLAAARRLAQDLDIMK
jgi:hypothetical protein